MRTTFILFLCVLSIGCARLSVEVDILNPIATDAASEDAALRQLYYRAAKETPQNVVDEVELLYQQNKDAYDKLVKKYNKMAGEEANSDLKEILKGSAENLKRVIEPGGTLYDLYKSLEDAIIKSNQEILNAAKNTPLNINEPIPPKLRQKLIARRDVERDAKKPILDNLREVEIGIESFAKEGEKAETRDEIQAVLDPVVKELRSIIGGPTLVESEYAYYVVSSPEELWAPHFNYAVGKGTFGNSDIVIKMGGQGDFTVKGMQFDPSTVAAVASKVTTQSLLLAAQIAGVPVSSVNFQDTESKPLGLAGTSDKITTIDQKLADREAKINAWKAAIRDISQSILSEEDSIVNGTVEDRNASGNAIKAIYDAYITILKLENHD